MDPTLFTRPEMGRIIPITTPVADFAFVPAALPPEWVPNTDTLHLLVSAAQELGRLDGAGRHTGNPDLLLRPLQRREALRSSSLEGTYATSEELLLFEVSASTKSESVDAVREVHNYGAALQLGLDQLVELPFCLRLIKNVHARLMQQVRGRDKRPGEFRKTQVHIGSNRRFIPAPPSHIEGALNDLESALHDRPSQIHELIWCFIVHYQFECIHPFNDGNGRVGRLLLAMMVTDQCGLGKPWLYMSAWFDRYKDEYIDLMFNVSAKGDWESWIQYCLRGVIAQAQDTVDRLNKLIELRANYQDQVAASGGSARLVGIVEYLFAVSPVVFVADEAKRSDVAYPTAKSDLKRLEKLGVLAPMTLGGRNAYFCPELVRVGME